MEEVKTIQVSGDYYIRCTYILVWFRDNKHYGESVGEKYYNTVSKALSVANDIKAKQGGYVVIREEQFYASTLKEALSDKWELNCGQVSSMIEEI